MADTKAEAPQDENDKPRNVITAKKNSPEEEFRKSERTSGWATTDERKLKFKKKAKKT